VSTVRLVGCGAKHTVAVLGNGDLFMWGRPDFGILGRAKSDVIVEPVLIDALWRREIGEGGADKARSLNKAEITELLNQQLTAQEIMRYYPDIEADSEAALFLAKAVAEDRETKVVQLQKELEEARHANEIALQKFIADQERAFEEKEKEGMAVLLERRDHLQGQAEMHEKAVFYQNQVAETLEKEVAQMDVQIEEAINSREDSLAQARTGEKATLAKALHLALESLKQAKLYKDHEYKGARKQAELAKAELESVQADLSLARVEIRKHEKLGYKKSIEHLRELVEEISALSQRLAETSLEHIDPGSHGVPTDQTGLRKLIELSNAEIDRICAQAGAFAADEHVDVSVRQQLATMLFDNAAMRKQLNAYTEGILLQTMDRLNQQEQGAVSGAQQSQNLISYI